MTIKVKGHHELNGRLTDASGRIDKETIAILRRAAVRVRRRQKELAPKKSGDLRKWIGYEIRGTRWRRVARIGPKYMGEMYPVYQELGTVHMDANPYVQPSLQDEDGKLADDLNAMLKGVLR